MKLGIVIFTASLIFLRVSEAESFKLWNSVNSDGNYCIGAVYGPVKLTPGEACQAWLPRIRALSEPTHYCYNLDSTGSTTSTYVVNSGGACEQHFQLTYCSTGTYPPICHGGYVSYDKKVAASIYSTELSCPAGFKPHDDGDKYRCYPVREKHHDRPNHCPAYQNPVRPLAGFKTESVDIFLSPALKVSYDTRLVGQETMVTLQPRRYSLDDVWSTSFDERLMVTKDPNGTIYSVHAQRGGYLESFFPSTNGFLSSVGSSVVRRTSSGWIETDVDNSRISSFDVDGYLVSVQSMDGARTDITYTSVTDGSGVSRLVKDKVTQWSGRQLTFTHSNINGTPRVTAVSNWDGNSATFTYTAAGYLTQIAWNNGEPLGLQYGNPDLSWALTAVVDAASKAYRQYSYDAAGHAISTRQGGLATGYSLSWTTPPALVATEYFDDTQKMFIRELNWQPPQGAKVLDPGGNEIAIESKVTNRGAQLSSASQSAGSGCLASIRHQDYDPAGNVAWKEDFSGNRTCYINDSTRNLETGRVEGLAVASSCDTVTPEGAALPSGARRTSTQWHPVWRLETKVAEPRRLTTKVYNGQPDPFNGGATAYCAPSNATLPDGSPIVVPCKQVEQATTDANGAQGFAATVDTTVPVRVQQWTYNQYGQVLTAKDPLNNTTTSTYYGDTTADHTIGDLATVTNALNQVVARYTKYNPAGQWLEMVDANGIATTRTFDLRQRLKTATSAGLTTSYDYWPTGLLKSVTLPDASSVNYGYDDAHRLISVTDNLGNKITYTLDNSGTRTAENVTDPTGRLAKTLTRMPDALNRIQQVSGRE